MNTVIDAATVPAAALHAAASPARLDLYAGIHKALRCAMGDTLVRLGRLDVTDDGERSQVVGQVEDLLALMRSHLEHENDFIHTAIEARRPGGARQTANDHGQHLDTLADLEDEAAALRGAAPSERGARALRLYRHLAFFVAENLEHMQTEESTNQALLWQLYDDAELAALHGRLVASIPPQEMAVVLRWMAASLTPQELTDLFRGMQAEAPPEAVRAMLDVAHAHMGQARWAKLARALRIPPVPGLVTA